MNKQDIIKKTANFVRKKLQGEGSGHDWWHVDRVCKQALRIGKKENADLFVVQLASLLHDVADWKFHDHRLGGRLAATWLQKAGVDDDTIARVRYIVDNNSHKVGTNRHKMRTLEGKVVQDADRLDAIGAIGIARVFAYGGHKNRPIHDPKIKPKIYRTFKELKKSKAVHTSINHFYEKLLWVKDKMNTKTGKMLASKRHKFMEKYLIEFYKEWEVK